MVRFLNRKAFEHTRNDFPGYRKQYTLLKMCIFFEAFWEADTTAVNIDYAEFSIETDFSQRQMNSVWKNHSLFFR